MIGGVEDDISRNSRSHLAIRSEILLSAINSLGQRLEIENDGTIAILTKILKASSSKEIIDVCRQFVCDIFGDSKLINKGSLLLTFASHLEKPTQPESKT